MESHLHIMDVAE